MNRRRRIVAPIATAPALALVCAATASAHVTLVSTSPARNSHRAHAPASVSMTFSGPIRSGRMTVKGPGGKAASVGHGGRDPRNIDRLLVQLKHGLKAGRYTVRASTIAADSHHQTWKFTFTVRK
jgi:copper transport protein